VPDDLDSQEEAKDDSKYIRRNRMKDYSEDQADLLSQELGIEDESEGSSQSETS
jgi:hypothetical protein